ncbi:hypothetical protein CLAIMM_13073, partial [Cladophialophora immunda]
GGLLLVGSPAPSALSTGARWRPDLMPSRHLSAYSGLAAAGLVTSGTLGNKWAGARLLPTAPQHEGKPPAGRSLFTAQQPRRNTSNSHIDGEQERRKRRTREQRRKQNGEDGIVCSQSGMPQTATIPPRTSHYLTPASLRPLVSSQSLLLSPTAAGHHSHNPS